MSDDLPPVPDTEGPKLHPYNSKGTPDIEFLEELGRGAHAIVYKIRLDGKIFALKVFLNIVVDAGWLICDWELGGKVDGELLDLQWRPFFAECRAYARLKEAKKEHLAAKCYGYINLTDAQEKELSEEWLAGNWWPPQQRGIVRYDDDDNPDLWPKRAIVKELIEGDEPFEPKHAERMISNLHALHRLGITIYDMKEDAYVAGQLVDFSKAVTIPHLMYDLYLDYNLDRLARNNVHSEIGELEGMFQDYNEKHKEGPLITASPMDPIRRLRSRPKTAEGWCDRAFNIRTVNWRRFSKVDSDNAQVKDDNLRTRSKRKKSSDSNRVTKSKKVTNITKVNGTKSTPGSRKVAGGKKSAKASSGGRKSK